MRSALLASPCGRPISDGGPHECVVSASFIETRIPAKVNSDTGICSVLEAAAAVPTVAVAIMHPSWTKRIWPENLARVTPPLLKLRTMVLWIAVQ